MGSCLIRTSHSVMLSDIFINMRSGPARPTSLLVLLCQAKASGASRESPGSSAA